jgi:hypothetical protein
MDAVTNADPARSADEVVVDTSGFHMHPTMGHLWTSLLQFKQFVAPNEFQMELDGLETRLSLAAHRAKLVQDAIGKCEAIKVQSPIEIRLDCVRKCLMSGSLCR